MGWRLATAVAGWLLATAPDAMAQGCSMCRTALGSADDPLARGFYWSILWLMSAPYLLFGLIGGWLVYRHVAAGRAVGRAAGRANAGVGAGECEPAVGIEGDARAS